MLYLNKEWFYLSKVDNKKGIISNRFTGNYIHIPIECFETLVYASKNNISLYEMKEVFEDKEDQKYYLKLLEILKELGVVDNKNNNKLNLSNIDKINISLTNRCNLHCGYCCTESGSSKNFKEMNLKEVKNMIDNILKNLNPKTINLSGGEIFVRDDIYEIIEYIRNNFSGYLIISTNGTLIKDEKIDFLINNIDSINISLDGYNEKTVSKERGRGTFTKVMSLIKNLKDKEFHKITLSLVESKQTESYIEEFRKLANDLGVKEIVRLFVALGRGKEKSMYVNEDMDIKFFEYNRNTMYDYKSAFESTIVCNAGVKSIFINHDGEIYPCANIQDDKFRICNVNDVNEYFIEKISNKQFKFLDNLEKIKTKSFEHCDECGYKLFCCECPAAMIAIYDNKKLLEHNCKKFKQELGIY